MNLLIDFGNSQIKTALADENSLLEITCHKALTLSTVKQICKKYKINKSIVSTVVVVKKNIITYLEKHTDFVELDYKSKLPFKNLYKTPSTLGKDRIAAVAGAVGLLKGRNILIVDLGTAITYEIINDRREYLGGNISPGLETRFKALHQFTQKLPLEKKKEKVTLIGKSTSEAIINGVQNGILFEIESYIEKLKKEMPRLAVVFTGGDAIFFEKMLKYRIFAEPNLVLIGLNRILEQNA